MDPCMDKTTQNPPSCHGSRKEREREGRHKKGAGALALSGCWAVKNWPHRIPGFGLRLTSPNLVFVQNSHRTKKQASAIHLEWGEYFVVTQRWSKYLKQRSNENGPACPAMPPCVGGMMPHKAMRYYTLNGSRKSWICIGISMTVVQKCSYHTSSH